MATREEVGLALRITADDDTGSGIRSATRGMGRLEHQVEDVDDAFARMRRRARSAFSAIRSGAATAFHVIGTGLKVALGAGIAGVVAGGGLIAKLIGTASEAEEIRSKFDAVFKGLSASTREWVNEQAATLGRSRLDLEQYMASLQDTFVPMGFAREESAKLSKQLAILGVDLASFNNAAEPETIELLTSALVGNHEAVRRFGIMITEATLKEEMARRAQKGLTLESVEQEKVMSRLGLIMRMTTDAQGDAERTADSFANRMRALKAAVRDAADQMGSALLPGTGDFVTRLTEWIVDNTKDGTFRLWGETIAGYLERIYGWAQKFIEHGGIELTVKFFKDMAESAASIVGVDFGHVASQIDSMVGSSESLATNFEAMADGIMRAILYFKWFSLSFATGLVAITPDIILDKETEAVKDLMIESGRRLDDEFREEKRALDERGAARRAKVKVKIEGVDRGELEMAHGQAF